MWWCGNTPFKGYFSLSLQPKWLLRTLSTVRKNVENVLLSSQQRQALPFIPPGQPFRHRFGRIRVCYSEIVWNDAFLSADLQKDISAGDRLGKTQSTQAWRGHRCENRHFILFYFIFFYKVVFFFFVFFFYFTILYWFCHTSSWIHHGCTLVPNLEPPSHLPPHTIPLGHPSAPAPSFLYPALNLDWRTEDWQQIRDDKDWVHKVLYGILTC